ncbi:hypothetical protein V1951_22175 [Yersinia sp. 2544 StPb PI]|uniref:hypothetical protein n=1 Tax=Yersinia sp. 2544 StPb PI TaxID=3117409 RepID=UPI003B28498F
MRKPQRLYDLVLPADADYKMESIYERDKSNFESSDKWLYVGADARNPNYAKIGMTMGDLVSRSYSSANPGFYLFCAFQCEQSTTKSQLEEIERSALCYLDSVFKREDGTTKRVCHFESGRISECYYDIDFEYFFQLLHDYLYRNHARYFQINGLESNDRDIVGDFLDCEFNQHLSREDINRYKEMILQF